MKSTKSRVLALFLSLLMVFSLLPMSAFAADANTIYVSNNGDDQSNNGEQATPVATLTKALSLVQDGGTIILLSDITDASKSHSIDKSVTIKSDDTRHTLTVKTLNISGDDKMVNLENLNITRTALNVTNDQGDGVYAIVAVGFDRDSQLDSTTPTVNIKDCEISISGSVAQNPDKNDNIQTAALRVGSGTVAVDNSAIKNTVSVTKVAAEAIQIDTAKSDGNDKTRSLEIKGSSMVECTNGSGVLFTDTVKKAKLNITSGTVKAKYCINYAGQEGTTVTVGQGVTLEGWSAVTVHGSGLTANINGAIIKSKNEMAGEANNYAVFAFESGSNNKVTVSGGNISVDGGASNSLSQRVASFYDGSNNSLEITDEATVKVENNTDDRWFTYKQNPSTAGDYTPSEGNGTVKIGDDVTIQTGEGVDASFVVKDKDGNIVNVTESFNSAVDLTKGDSDAVEEGSTIVVGENATIEGTATVPAGLTVDVTKNDTVAQQVKPAEGVIVVYGIVDGDKTEDKSFSSGDSGLTSDVLNIDSVGFKAKAADALSAINAALTAEGKGHSVPENDVANNTAYIVLDHRVAGKTFKVEVKKDDVEVYKESPAEGGTARVFYFTFPADDKGDYTSGSPAAKKIAPGEYTVKLYADDIEIAGAEKTVKIYEVKYEAGDGVTGDTVTVYTDADGLDAAKTAVPEGFTAQEGYNSELTAEAGTENDCKITVTVSAKAKTSVTVVKAPLGEGANVSEDYSVTGTGYVGETVNVTISASSLTKHDNGQGTVAGWVGFGVPVEGDANAYTYKIQEGDGVESDLESPKTRTITVDGKTYATIYVTANASGEIATYTVKQIKDDVTTTYIVKVTVTELKDAPVQQSNVNISAIPDANGKAATVETAAELDGGVLKVTVGGEIFTSHSSTSPVNAWWAGIGFEVPEGATKVKYKVGTDSEFTENNPDLDTWGDGKKGFALWLDASTLTEEGLDVELEWLNDQNTVVSNTKSKIFPAKDLKIAPFSTELVDFGYGATKDEALAKADEGRKNANGAATGDGWKNNRDWTDQTMWLTFKDPIPKGITLTVSVTPPSGATEEYDCVGNGKAYTYAWSYKNPDQTGDINVEVGIYKIDENAIVGKDGAEVEIAVAEGADTAEVEAGEITVSVTDSGFKAKAEDAKTAINNNWGGSDVEDVIGNTLWVIFSQSPENEAGVAYDVNILKDGEKILTEQLSGVKKGGLVYVSLDDQLKDKGAGEYVFQIVKDGVAVASKSVKVYEVKYAAGENGTVVQPEKPVYVASEAEAEELTKPDATANSGYHTSGWTKSTEDYVITYTANFAKNATGGGGSATPSATVKTDSTTNGNFTVSDKYAGAGKTVTVTPKANTGYVVDQVTVTDKNGKAVTVKDNGDGTYSFVMPEKAAQPVTVKVTFKLDDAEKDCPSEKFTDVDQSAWYHEGVDYAIKNGLMEGTGTTTFAPNATTTRAMVVTVLYRLAGEPAVTKDVKFSDVPAGRWYSNAINWAAANGVVDGYGNGKFGPDDTITREQMAAILYRYATLKGYNVTNLADLSGYTDAGTVSGWATNAMRWTVAEGVIEGTSKTTLAPSGDSTRAQVATILMRFCEDIVK